MLALASIRTLLRCLCSCCHKCCPYLHPKLGNFLLMCGQYSQVVDAVVCDPPYGVRAGGRKSQSIPDRRIKDRTTHISATAPYFLGAHHPHPCHGLSCCRCAGAQ